MRYGIEYNPKKGELTLIRLPPRGIGRRKFLDKRKLFQCPQCLRCVPWDFGADVGLEKDRDLLTKLEEKLDSFLRMCCDGCWAKIVNKKQIPNFANLKLT